MSVTTKGTKPAYIEHARVLDVDIATYTVTVATEFTKKPLTGLSFATPYQHYSNGEGIYFMPEVGALCWVCAPSDGNMPFIIAFAPGQDEADYRSQKQDLNPGDIYLGTRDENFLILRRGGIVQIGGGPLSQRMFIPVNNTIKDFCENYSLNTVGGALEWTVKHPAENTSGSSPTNLKVSARQNAIDKQPIAFLEIGSHDGDDKTILSLIINASGDKDAAASISLAFDKEGTVTWHFEKDIDWTVGGAFTLTSEQDMSLTSNNGAVNIESSSGNMTLTGKSGIMIQSDSRIDIKSAAVVNLGAKVMVKDGAIPVALATPLLIWLASHTHLCAAPASPSGPPVPPPPGSIASTVLTAQ